MKRIWMGLALAALLAPAAARPDTLTVICNGCGETEYAELAMRASTQGESVVVVDATKQQLRKYLVWSYLGRLRDRYEKKVILIDPTAEEQATFDTAVDIVGDWEHSLQNCGPGGVGDWLVPDLGMEMACAAHDAGYADGGDEADRSQCDNQLFLDMLMFGAPVSMATAFFLAVRSAGM